MTQKRALTICAAIISAALCVLVAVRLAGEEEARALTNNISRSIETDEPGVDTVAPITVAIAPELRTQASAADGEHYFAVTDRSGDPLSGTCISQRVHARSFAKSDGLLGVTGEDGVLRVRLSAMDGLAAVVASKPGFASKLFDVAVGGDGTDVVLDAGFTIEIAIQSESGDPITGAPVAVSQLPVEPNHLVARDRTALLLPGVDARSAVTTVSSDSDGLCQIGGLAPGTYYVYPPPWLLVSGASVPLEVAVPQVDAVVITGEAIYGYALRFSGEGVVSAFCTGGGRGSGDARRRRFIQRARSTLQETGGFGTLVSVGLLPRGADGQLEFTALLADGTIVSRSRKPKRIDRLAKTEIVDCGDIAFDTNQCGRVRVTVLDLAGNRTEAAPRINLMMRPDPESAVGRRVGMVLSSLQPGKWRYLPLGVYQISMPPGMYDTEEIGGIIEVKDRQEIDLTLHLLKNVTDCTFAFHLEGAAVRPAICELRISPEGGGDPSRILRDGAPKIFRHITEGQYLVRFEAPGFATERQLIDVFAEPTGAREYVIDIRRN